MIHCVLGDIDAKETGRVLPHEHIVCTEQSTKVMFGEDYYNRDEVISAATGHLLKLKTQCGLGTFVDCTTPNLGRDIDLLKSVSKASGVNIVAATGYYYGVEPMLSRLGEEYLTEAMLADVRRNPIGVIKAAVEYETVGDFQIKMLKASAKVHSVTNLPIIVHTNANNENGLKAAEILLECGVPANRFMIGHLSDAANPEIIYKVAELGCYIGLDRLGLRIDANHHLGLIEAAWKHGYGKQMLLSHDEITFSSFAERPLLKPETRYGLFFNTFIPELQKRGLTERDFDLLCRDNPLRFLDIQE